MTTQLYIVLALYLACNLYLTGRYAENVVESSWWRIVAFHLVSVLGAGLIHVVAGLCSGIKELASLFQITFLFKLLVLGKFRDATPEQLERFGMYLYPYSTIRGRVQRFCLALWKKKVAKHQSRSNAVTTDPA